MSLAVMLARQRSGTGALGTILDQHPQVHYFGEVFHQHELGRPQGWLTFLQERVRTRPAAALPTSARENFEAYLERLDGLHAKTVKVLDVKYNSTHHFNGMWASPLEPPAFLRWIREKQLPAIHLTRRNFLKTFVSQKLADANEVWHAREGQELRHASVALEVGPLLRYLERTAREVELMFGFLRGHAPLVTLDYEELLDTQGALAGAAEARLRQALGVGAFEKRTPVFRKQVRDQLHEVIENFGEIRRALARTPHSWMLSG